MGLLWVDDLSSCSARAVDTALATLKFILAQTGATRGLWPLAIASLTCLQMNTAAADNPLMFEVGFGQGFARYSGGADLSFLDQPLNIARSDLLGGRGKVWNAGAWLYLSAGSPLRVGVEYVRHSANVAVFGFGEDGVDILADPTEIEIFGTARRQQVFLNLAYEAPTSTRLSPSIAVGIGTGGQLLNQMSVIRNAFLGEITDSASVKSKTQSIQLQLGQDVSLTGNFFLGLRSKRVFDVSEKLSGVRSGQSSFLLVAGLKTSQPVEKTDRLLESSGSNYLFSFGYEQVQGSYSVNLRAKIRNPLDEIQLLEFRTKGLVNGNMKLFQASLWRNLDLLCRSGPLENHNCPWKIGLQTFHQSGRGRFVATVSEEGPLVGRDQVLDVVGSATAISGVLNFAYMPDGGARFLPKIGVGIGVARVRVRLRNIDPAQDVFDETSDRDFRMAGQVFFGVDYRISERVRVGITSRFMKRQLSSGISVSAAF